MDEWIREDLMDGLCPSIRPLVACMMDCEGGCRVLDLFRRRPLTWLQVSDISYHVSQPREQLDATLNRLVGLGILECLNVSGIWTFYGLTRDARILECLEQFWVWRDDWQTRWGQVQETLQLGTPDGSYGD